VAAERGLTGSAKQLQVRNELVDPETLRVRGELFTVIGRMAVPHWHRRTTDRDDATEVKGSIAEDWISRGKLA
jgi:hypothetical protein